MVRLFHPYVPGRTLLLAASETLLIALALLGAIFARFGADAELALLYEGGVRKILAACAVCVLCMYYYDLYDSSVLHRPGEVLSRLMQVLGTACLILALLYYFWPDIRLRQDLLLVWVILAGVLLTAWRRLFVSLNRSPRLGQSTLLLGDGPLAKPLASEIEGRPELGLNLLGYLEEPGRAVSLDGLPHLGGVEELSEVVQRRRISRIILTMGDRRGKLPVERLLHLKAHGVMVEDAVDVYEAITGRVPLESLRLSWLLFSHGFRLSPAMLFYKRTSSIVLSVLGLALTLPLLALIALAVRLDSRGPALFRQKRVGKDGRIFTLFKFRSMRVGADPETPAQENDDRCTRVGRWLRRFRLDELPQLYNILRGDMHFIGPRPFTPKMEERLAREILFYTQRWSIRPGATGWAQIQQGYCATLQENIGKLSYDLFYIKNLSVGLDFLILLKTAKILLLGRGAR